MRSGGVVVMPCPSYNAVTYATYFTEWRQLPILASVAPSKALNVGLWYRTPKLIKF